MKKLNKIEINPERLLKNEDLKTIKGGYSWVYCHNLNGPCGDWPVADCGMIALEFCEKACPDWTHITCTPGC